MSNKKIFIWIIILLGILVILPNISAVATLNSPVTGGNYSTTLIINCTSSGGLEHALNASIWYNISGNPSMGTRLLTITNTTTNQTNFNITATVVSITGLTDGLIYNMSCLLNNGSTGNLMWSANVTNIAIDHTPPAVAFAGTTFVLWGNYSGASLIINTTINDITIGMSRVYFNVTNSAGVQSNWSVASNISGEYTLTFDTTGITTDGTYNVTIYANDTLSNVNSTIAFSVKFDNTAPTGTFTCIPASASVGDTVACSCSSSDATSGVLSTTYTSSYATPETGSYTKTCSITDHAGLSLSLTATYIVEGNYGTGGSSGGSSTTTTWTKSIPINNEQFESSSGYTNQMAVKNKVTMTIAGESHHVGVKSLTATSATIEIASVPVSVTLDIGEDAKVDVDDDGTYDVYVILNSIANNKADITIKKISEAVPAGEGSTTTTGDIEGGDETPGAGSNTWVYVIVIIVILVIVGIVFAKKKK